MHGTGVAMLLGLGLLALPLKAYGVLVHAPALWSRAGTEQVLTRLTPFYADLRWVRAQVPPGAPILCLVRNCQYLGHYRREDAFFRLVEQHTDARGIDPRPVWHGLLDQGIRHVFMRGETVRATPDGRAPMTATDWLAHCGGRVVYRNPAGRFGTRDPRRVGTGIVVLVELRDALDGPARRLESPCERPTTAW